MVFVNRRLGNGFAFKAIDSTRDQEHYFSSNRKEISLVIRGTSGSGAWEQGRAFSLSASTTLLLSWSLTDSQNASVDSGAFSVSNFGVEPAQAVKRFDSKMSFKVSSSDESFDATHFQFFFKDKNSATTQWQSFQNLTESTNFSNPAEDGFRELSFMFDSTLRGAPTISLNSASSDSFFTIINLTGTYHFKDIGLEYSQHLTADGVEFYKNVDNPNIRYDYVNRNLMPVVGPEIYVNNSGSIGPRTLAFSVKYNSGSVERYSLKNISEFPHSSGFFQMRNMILGTTDSGKIGESEDSIIRVRFFGSFVTVMWPKQDDQLAPVRGLADLSSGERAGKLSTQFTPGEFVHVGKYDHMSLFGYALVQESGTLDSIEIRIERRPLRALAFAKEQAIQLGTSSSFGVDVTTAEVQDIIYKKQINYGNTEDPSQSFVIDVPLTNVKDIRISARHTNGQASDLNKNFIMWSRFIESEIET